MHRRSIAKLKDKARVHEQNEEWAEAIAAYQQALKVAEEGEGELELSLFNRIGDLYMRDGKEESALRYYELAADHYEEAGLYNSAIALCNKVIRHDPHRPEPYYKLGRLSLAQGFISEARRWSVEYAERMLRAGKRNEAFAALNEFASHASDPEIRELLAQYLLAHGETAEALSQLLAAYQARLEGGQTDQANALREKILAIDPTADLGDGKPGTLEIGGDGLEGGRDEGQVEPQDQGLVVDLSDQLSDASVDLEIGPAADLPAPTTADEPLELLTAADSAGIEHQGTTLIQAEEVNIELTLVEAAPDPVVDQVMDPITDQAAKEVVEPEAATSPESVGLLDLELALDTGGGDLADDGPPLPLIGEDDSILLDLELPREPDPAESAGSEPSGMEPPTGMDPAPLAPPTTEPAPLEAAGIESASLEPSIAETAPLDLTGMGSAPLEPATTESAVPEPTGMESVPLEPAATEAVGSEPAPAKSAPAKPATTSPADSSYVDLGDLLFGEDETETGLTRYVVEAPSPSGDEDRDFLELLSQFKAKISEHLGDEDADSRYDLGLAFKEMGLYDEAIAQFQIALRGLGDQLRIYEELGDCFIQKGEYSVALKILKGALRVSTASAAESIGVHYQLGRSYEELGRVEEARDAYERVVALDLEFRDAAARLSRL